MLSSVSGPYFRVWRAKATHRRKGFFGLTLPEAQESITIMVGNMVASG